jgi:DNA-binding transcriptional MerR regulator
VINKENGFSIFTNSSNLFKSSKKAMSQQLDLFGSPISLPTISKTLIADNEISIVVTPSPPFSTIFEEITKRKRGRPQKEKPINATPHIKLKRGRKSLAETIVDIDLVDVPSDEELQKKMYYPISQVAKWFNVTNSQIRYWENEFNILQPRKNKKGDRLFRPEDVKNLKTIYYLLRHKKLSVEGAKEYLKANEHKTETKIQLQESLLHFKSFLLELKANLK